MSRVRPLSLAAGLALALLACGACQPSNSIVARDERAKAVISDVSLRYLELALGLGLHDPDYVDAFFGDTTLRAVARTQALTLPQLREHAEMQIARLDSAPPPSDAKETLEHQRYLRRQLEALAFRARMVGGEHFSFDQESSGLYDAVSPPVPDAEMDSVLARIDALLPGQGPLADRYLRFRKALIIPPAKLDTVFKVAIAEARRRTREHMTLPDSESFVVEYVHNQPWGGYNWYQGRGRSLIQVNIDLPIYADRALDLACHEGYPGHHVQNLLAEHEQVDVRHWQEFTLQPLFAPSAMIAEGSAVVAASVAFPGVERANFEKRVLFPLAGLDTTLYDRFETLREAMEALSPVQIENARRYPAGSRATS